MDTFGDRTLQHIAMRVEQIEPVVAAMKARGDYFAGEIVGARGTRLRQVFTTGEIRQEKAFSVLELIERRNYEGFISE